MRTRLTERLGDSKTEAIPGSASPTDIWATSKKNFDAWDLDDDGYLESDEIEKGIVDDRNKGVAAATLLSFQANLSTIENLSNDQLGSEAGISRNDLAKLTAEGAKSKNNAQVAGNASWYLGNMTGAAESLYGGSSGPNGLDVKQNQIASCSFLSTAIALADRDPEAIKKMIREHPDGSYTVTFPGSKRPVRVSKLTHGELGRAANAGANGRWITVLEKAYGKLRNEKAWIKGANDQRGAEWQSPTPAVNALTGNSSDADILAVTRDSTTRRKLKRAFANRDLVMAGTGPSLFAGNDGIVNRHTYTVIGYDEKRDVVRLRNPWGRTELNGEDGKAKDGNDDGVFEMKLDDFTKRFGTITYETRRPAGRRTRRSRRR